MRIRQICGIAACVSALLVAPSAALGSGSTAPAVTAAVNQAAALGTPTTASQLAIDAATVQPAVQTAVAGGAGNVQALLAQGGITIGDAVLQGATATETTTSDATVVADSTTCYGSRTEKYQLSTAGVTLAWRQVEIGGWCGNGVSVTSYDGPIYSSYETFPYCWADVSQSSEYQAGPDGPHVFFYADNTGEVGEGIGPICGGLKTDNAWITIKGNGYSTQGGNG
jgi:hypothetical protein